MKPVNIKPSSQLELQCTHHTIILRNKSLEYKYPGGLEAFRKRYVADSNNRITAHCTAEYVLGNTLMELESVGLDQAQDYVVINTVEWEMWRMIHTDKIEKPFWFETGADWLKYKQRKGRVVVWYNG